MVGVSKFDLRVVRQAGGNDVQLQVFIVLHSGTEMSARPVFVFQRCFVRGAHLRADPQAPLQALLVFGHAQGEVAVPAVHRAHPALQLRHVRMAFLHQVVRQLDQQLHLLLGLLGQTQAGRSNSKTGTSGVHKKTLYGV